MDVQATVVFADFTGSTAFYQALGTEKASHAVTRLTQWIGDVCEAHHGRVVKRLGEGVLAIFSDAGQATNAAMAIQRGHQLRLLQWPEGIRMEIKAGIAHGEVTEVKDDCAGDAVNVASRLGGLSGSNQIWATESVRSQLDGALAQRFISLGPVSLRGRQDPVALYKIEWQEDAHSDLLTRPAGLAGIDRVVPQHLGQIHLTYQDTHRRFSSADMPVYVGRADRAEFFISDPRVSRLHARIEWRDSAFFITDLSSFGTWVRFAGSDTDTPLRRDACQLHGTGEVALGIPFSATGGPTLQFSFSQPPPALD